MMGKVREALYNTLVSFGVFESEPRFLDLFCGSGSVGVEALSRGAAHATFVDLAVDCCAVAERNAAACGFEGQGK
jgi:16S rRNA (guanine966-N2)-methyltransferase